MKRKQSSKNEKKVADQAAKALGLSEGRLHELYVVIEKCIEGFPENYSIGDISQKLFNKRKYTEKEAFFLGVVSHHVTAENKEMEKLYKEYLKSLNR